MARKRQFKSKGGSGFLPRERARFMEFAAAVLLTVITLQVSAASYGQRVTLSGKNLRLEQIFTAIREQTGYHFMYLSEDLSRASPVDLQAKNAALKTVLDRCFAHQPLTYTIDGAVIIVKPRAASTEKGTAARVLKLTGVVLDSATSQPLSGVTIQVKGSTAGTVTDAKGQFSLEVPDDAARLVVRSLGYRTKEVAISGQTPLRIELATAATGLNQVVVVGYGTQKKKDLTGAISTIGHEDIRDLPVRSAQEAMQGKVAGVLVTQSSGSPGSLGVVHIRGIGSINGSNSPLYIVDGLPQSSIGWLNPNVIENISVLKDASSAAIYGARASNGVVIITTKKGKAGEGVHVTFDAYYGVQSPWKRPHMLDAESFIDYKVRAAKAAGEAVPQEFSTPEKVDQVLDFVQANAGSRKGTDWWKEVTHYGAPIQNYDLGVTAGTEKLRVASSLGYMKQDGIVIGTNYSRVSWHNNVGIDISKRVKLRTHFSLVYEDRQNTGEQNPWTGTVFLAMACDPITPVFRNDLQKVPSFYSRLMDGYEPDNPFSQYAGILYTNKLNPVAQIDRLEQNVWEGIGVKGGTSLEVKLLDPLSFQSNFSVDIERGISKGFTPSYFLNPNDFSTLNTVSNNSSWSNYFVWDNTLTYDKIWGNSHLTLMGGTSTELTKGLTYAASIQGIVNNKEDMRIINAGTQNPGASGYKYSNSLLSFFGRVNYAYKDKYILTGNIRRDGSSNFGQGHEWGTFPSVSAAWRISNESFVQGAGWSWLQEAKLRASYGLIGNQNVGGGAYLSTYGNTARYLFGNPGSPYLGAGRTAVGNAGLQWETSKQLDVGLEATMWNGELSFALDYFDKKVDNMLLQLPLPTTLGYPNFPWVNAGSMQNKGWEVAVTHKNQLGEFKYAVTANVSTFHNEVTSLGGGGAIYSTAHLGEVLTATEVGRPVGYYFGWQTDGIFQTREEVDNSPQKGLSTAGDLRFKDVKGTDENGKVVAGADGVLNSADRVMIGNPWPDFTYGLTLNGSYKNVDVSIFFQGAQGNDVMNILRYDIESGTGWYNAPRGFLDKAWNGAGSTNQYYKISQNAALNTNVSSYYVEDGSYLRIKNVQLGYTFPSSWLQRVGIAQLRVYVAAQNLLTITGYSGLDPEIGSGDPKLRGIDQGYYPQARIFLFGINASF